MEAEIWTDLPTEEQAQECLYLINQGRVAFDLEPLEFLEFDSCEPNNGYCCVSATNLSVPLGGQTGSRFFTVSPTTAGALAEALGTEARNVVDVEIPYGILAVTNPFDELGQTYGAEYQERRAALRRRLVDAGVVED